MKATQLEPFPKNESPMMHDLYHMGKPIDSDIMVLYGRHEGNAYIIIHDRITGERTRIDFDGRKVSAQESVYAPM